jgi:hypothetical protein
MRDKLYELAVLLGDDEQSHKIERQFKQLHEECREADHHRKEEDDPRVHLDLSRGHWATTEVKRRAPKFAGRMKTLGLRKRVGKTAGRMEGDLEAGTTDGSVHSQAIPLQPMRPASVSVSLA